MGALRLHCHLGQCILRANSEVGFGVCRVEISILGGVIDVEIRADVETGFCLVWYKGFLG